MQDLDKMLEDRGLNKNDPTVKFALEQKLIFGGLLPKRKQIPEESLGKNERNQNRTQREAREIVSRVFQVRGEFHDHSVKWEEVKAKIRKMRWTSKRSPTRGRVRSIDQFSAVS